MQDSALLLCDNWLKSKTKSERWLIFVGVVLAAFYVSQTAFNAFMPKGSLEPQLNSIKARYELLKSAGLSERVELIKSQIDSSLQQTSELKERANYLKNRLNALSQNTNRLSLILEQISQKASGDGVLISDISSLASELKSGEFNKAYEIGVVAVGEYGRVMGFIGAVEGLGELISIEDVRLASTANGVSARLNIAIWGVGQ